MTNFVTSIRRMGSLSLVLCLGLLAGCRTPKSWTMQPQSTPPPPELGGGQDDSQDFNVVWDKTNANKAPLNPRWGSQKRVGKLPPAACSQNPYQCTSQNPAMDRPTGLNDGLCSLAALGAPFYGHADWGVAEYQGAIGWYNFNVWDGDYDWVLKREKLEGVTQNNFPQGQNPNNPQFVELEFDSRETAPHFGDAGWWPGLSEKAWDGLVNGSFDEVDTYLHPGNPAKKYLACGVVSGLFGLDCDHGCRSEVHPVYTMAIQINEDPQDNEWAVFVRNWGTGGFCSGWNDQVTASQMAVVLPVTASSAPTDVSIEQFAGTAGVGCPIYGYVPGAGEQLVFDLPAPIPENEGMAVMLVKMKWPNDAQTMQCANVDVNELRRLRGDIVSGASETDAEGMMVRAMRQVGMVPTQGRAPAFSRDVAQPYLMSHPAKPSVQKLMQGATQTQKVCPAPTAPHALEMKLAQPPPEYPRHKLAQDAPAAARNEAMVAALCGEYSKQNKPLTQELQKVCSDKRVKSKQ